MYSQLIKRARLYLELKNQCDQNFKNGNQIKDKKSDLAKKDGLDQSQSFDDHQNFQIVKFLQSYNKKSLLLTKENLIKIIRYLHEENLAILGSKDKKICNLDQPNIHEEKKQKEQIQKLKLRKQIYAKELKEKTKVYTDLKIKIQSCEQYLNQLIATIDNLKTYNNKYVKTINDKAKKTIKFSPQTEINQILINSKTQREKVQVNQYKIQPQKAQQQAQSQQERKSIIKQPKDLQREIVMFETSQSYQVDESAMLELIRGFQKLKQKPSSKIIHPIEKDRHPQQQQKSYINQNSFIASLKKVKPIEESHFSKHHHQDSISSSIIQTSSFMANYHRPHGAGSGLSSSIRDILKNSNNFEENEEYEHNRKACRKNQKIIHEQDSVLETQRKLHEAKLNSQIHKKTFTLNQKQYTEKSPRSETSFETSYQKQHSISNLNILTPTSPMQTSQFKSHQHNFINLLNKFNPKK